jgi:phage shock protein PspC (stress-responsive transcriptional regulator)
MSVSPASPARPADNLFGICAAIGHDFGFNPLWLRLVLATTLLWNPVAVISAYAVLGLSVAVSRLAFPARRRATRLPARPA